jgi:hypothetical protein
MSDKSEKIDVLLELYKQSILQALHYQNQRSTLSSLISTLTAASFGLVILDKSIGVLDLPFTFLVSILGVAGSLFATKYHERYYNHALRADGYRDALGELTDLNGTIGDVKSGAEDVVKRGHPYIHNVLVVHLWVSLHLFVAASGILLTILILFSWWFCGQMQLFTAV